MVNYDLKKIIKGRLERSKKVKNVEIKVKLILIKFLSLDQTCNGSKFKTAILFKCNSKMVHNDLIFGPVNKPRHV